MLRDFGCPHQLVYMVLKQNIWNPVNMLAGNRSCPVLFEQMDHFLELNCWLDLGCEKIELLQKLPKKQYIYIYINGFHTPDRFTWSSPCFKRFFGDPFLAKASFQVGTTLCTWITPKIIIFLLGSASEKVGELRGYKTCITRLTLLKGLTKHGC